MGSYVMRILNFIFWLQILVSFNIEANDSEISSDVVSIKKILTLNINSSINPATFNYIESGLKRGVSEGYNLIIIP